MHAFFIYPKPLPDQIAKAALVGAVFCFPISQAAAYIFMVLSLTAWIVAGGYQQRYSAIRSHTFAWSTLALVLLILIGALYSSGDPQDVQRHATKYLKLAFIPLAMTLLQEERCRRYSLNAFVLAMSITLAISMLSLFVEIPFMKGNSGSLAGNHYVFKDHIAQNLMMAFFVMIMLVKGQQQIHDGYRFAYWTAALIGVINILGFVHGRTGYIALLVILVIFLLVYTSPRRRWQSLLALFLAGAIVLPFSDGFRSRVELAVQQMKTHTPEKVTSVGARIEMTRVSVALIGERPVLGWGTGAYRNQFCDRAVTEELCAVGGYHPHNQFLSFGVQLGLLGLLAYLAFLVTAIREAWHFSRPERTLAFGLLGILVVDSMLHAPLFLVGEAQFFILMLALVMAKSIPVSTRKG